MFASTGKLFFYHQHFNIFRKLLIQIPVSYQSVLRSRIILIRLWIRILVLNFSNTDPDSAPDPAK